MEFARYASLSSMPSWFFWTYGVKVKKWNIRNPSFLPTFNYHFFHSLDLCPSYMKPPSNFRVEVTYLQINVCSFPLYILCLMIYVIHLLKLTLKACFKGLCIIKYISCNSFVQFVGTNTRRMLGCFF